MIGDINLEFLVSRFDLKLPELPRKSIHTLAMESYQKKSERVSPSQNLKVQFPGGGVGIRWPTTGAFWAV